MQKGGAMTTDPFDALREPIAPIAPRRSFANDLRRRVADALGVRAGEGHTKEIREYTPARLHSITPYLSCLDAAAAIEWYQHVFDARLLGDPIIMEDGRVGHAELRIGDSVFMLAGEYPEENHLSPETLGGSTTAFQLYVQDADETYVRAVANGATALRPLAENYGARQGTLRDPFGHRWFICTHLAVDDVPVEDAPGRRFGDVGYVTLEVPDGDRARRFFEALFGWTLDASGEPGSFHISSITPPAGIHAGQAEPDVRLYFRVDDIEAVTARVRELGGQVLAMTNYESGGNAECVDDQGLRFDLFRPRAGY
jgi:uncharacterized glyoxalase superfamily protein PhnB